MPRTFVFLAFAGLIALGLLTGCATEQKHFEVGDTQHGLASWYGSDFDGKLTADGETFHKNDLTAAHRRLPFNTVVRVTNLNNGRSVEVRINDRGPWGDSDRIIDVSEAAADILQMKGPGIVPVELVVIQLGSRRH